MTIFDEESRRKIAEESEPRQVALRISAALLSYLANHPNRDIEVQNPMTLYRQSSGDRLDITYSGPNAFLLRTSMGFQGQVQVQMRRSAVDTVTLSELEGRVAEWLGARRAA
jgi:hypothetical protein